MYKLPATGGIYKVQKAIHGSGRLMAKRLESGGFKWPSIQDGVMRVTAAQLGALLEGLDWRRVHGGRRPMVPQIAG